MTYRGFQLEVRANDAERTEVAVAGAIDLASAYDFDDALRRIERDGAGRMILDLRGLDFMDSAGLARIVALRSRCRRASRPLTLVRGPKAVERLLALARLDDQFDVVVEPAAAG